MRYVAFLVASLVCLPAAAQDEPELPDPTERCPGAAEVTTLQRDGADGYWFPDETGRCALSRLQMLPRYWQRVQLLQQRLEVSDERTALLRRQVQLAQEEAETAAGALAAAERQARERAEEANTERNLRWLWFGLGVVVVVAVEALALWALSELRVLVM